MYLKSIEVQGFKSFANRLVFEFNKGITGIVGPNGSGKSNIADAVRWVLGEQSARQLRGQKMEDVIFAGTQNRKPLGFAFVSITLDNSDHALPISYDTVTVSRRVFRSGESEYKINGHSCRLRDIQELFFDTGIGKEGYSIIGQGQIDRILSGKPEDRRELFDEAAGIVKYKKRKAYALKDLEEEERNISRARDIAHELEVQLAPLREQSEKARSFLKLRDDLKLYEANMYIVSFDKLKSDGADVEDKLHIIEAQIEDTRSQYEAIKSKYTQVEALMEEYDRKINALQEEAGERAIRLQKLEGSRDLLTSRKENLAGSISQGTGRLGEIRKGISEKAAQIEKLKADLEKYTEEYETSSAQGDKGASELADIRGKSQALREEMEALSAREMDIMGRISGQKNRREHVRAQDEQAALRRSELSSRLIALKSQTSSDTDLAASYREERDRIEADIEKNETAGADLTRQAEDLEKEYSGSAAALAEQQKSFHEGSARYKTLRNITERYEGYSGSIRRVMENKDREKGLIGLVSDIIKVDRDYETAIETALGGSISNIVTEDEDTARRMIEFLKKNRYGRATFLPLTSIRGRKAQASEGVRGEAGFIGMGDELVKTDDRYKNIASFLLGRIYIVDNMDHALAIARKYRYSFRIVTLGGESLNPGGSISGGAYKKTGNLLARHREMDELKAHVDQLSGRIRELAKGLEELDGRRQKMARERQKIRSDHEQLLLGRNTVQMQLSQLEGRNAESEKTIADIEKELARMESDKKERGDILAAIDGQIDDLARQKEETSGRSGQAGQELKKLSQREEELSARNTELKIRYSKLRQRLDFTKENIERNENEKKALAEEIENINSQMDQTRNRSLQLEEEEKELLAQIQDCQRSISQGTGKADHAEREDRREKKQPERSYVG